MKTSKHAQPAILPNWQFICQRPAYFLAFGLGSGLSKKAPGTIGTLAAIPLYGLLHLLGFSSMGILLLTLMLFFVGIWAAHETTEALKVDDYGGIVIDEMVGMWLVLALAPPMGFQLVLSFGLFRLFDIFKPWPIRYFDQKVGGGLGIMMDDVVAALMALGVLYLFDFII